MIVGVIGGLLWLADISGNAWIQQKSGDIPNWLWIGLMIAGVALGAMWAFHTVASERDVLKEKLAATHFFALEGTREVLRKHAKFLNKMDTGEAALEPLLQKRYEIEGDIQERFKDYELKRDQWARIWNDGIQSSNKVYTSLRDKAVNWLYTLAEDIKADDISAEYQSRLSANRH